MFTGLIESLLQYCKLPHYSTFSIGTSEKLEKKNSRTSQFVWFDLFFFLYKHISWQRECRYLGRPSVQSQSMLVGASPCTVLCCQHLWNATFVGIVTQSWDVILGNAQLNKEPFVMQKELRKRKKNLLELFFFPFVKTNHLNCLSDPAVLKLYWSKSQIYWPLFIVNYLHLKSTIGRKNQKTNRNLKYSNRDRQEPKHE